MRDDGVENITVHWYANNKRFVNLVLKIIWKRKRNQPLNLLTLEAIHSLSTSHLLKIKRLLEGEISIMRQLKKYRLIMNSIRLLGVVAP